MQYLLSVVHDEVSLPSAPEELERAYKDVGAFNEELVAADAMVFAGGLTTFKDAKTFEYKDDEVTVVDGPFSDEAERMGGFWVINANDEATASEWARKATAACRHRVELRPFQGE